VTDAFDVRPVRDEDLGDLLPLVRAYLDFYECHDVGDAEMLDLSRALLADPEKEGVQFLARRRADGAAVGFASLFWSWTTTRGGRLGGHERPLRRAGGPRQRPG